MANPLKTAARRLDMQSKSVPSHHLLSSWQYGRALWSDWTTEKAISDGFKINPWVYKAVTIIAESAASVPWIAYTVDREGNREEIHDSPLTALLREPNAHMNGNDLFERMVMHLLLGGNALWSKIRVGRTVVELWPIMPDLVKPVPSRQDFISHYEIKHPDGNRQRVETPDILHVMLVDPSNVYWGIAPLLALARTVDTDVEAITWNKVALQNRALPTGAISFSQPISEKQWEEARTAIREQHQGGDNARNMLTLPYGASWQQMSMSPAEMDFIESRKMTREEILGIYGVPPPMAGLYDNATLANIETSRTIFWRDRIIPFLDKLQTAFNHGLTPDFGQGIEIAYDISAVDALQEDFHQKIETAHTLFSMGVPFNVINQQLELGFDAVDGGDTGYLPANLLPAGIMLSDMVGDADVPALPSGDDARALSDGRDTKAVPESEEQKTLYWKSFENRRAGWYGQVAKKSREVFAAEMNRVADSLENGQDAALGTIRRGQAAWETLLRASYTAMIEAFGGDTFDDLTKSAPHYQTRAFDPWDAIIQQWVATISVSRARLIAMTSHDAVRAIIAQAFADGLSVDAVARQVREYYEVDAVRRAWVLARTEVVSASNAGAYFGAQQSGVVTSKVWVSSRDGRVRDDHQDADGQTRPLDEPFRVGRSSMMYPGDPSGAAEQVINCRCVEAFSTRRE